MVPSAYFVKCPGRGTCAFELLPHARTVQGLVAAVAARLASWLAGAGGGQAGGNGGDKELPLLRLAWNGKTLSAHGAGRFSAPGGGGGHFGAQKLAELGLHPGATLEVRRVQKTATNVTTPGRGVSLALRSLEKGASEGAAVSSRLFRDSGLPLAPQK